MRKPLAHRTQRIEALKPSIRGRDEWGADLPVGPLTAEEDVRFLLVHHTASSNDYGQEEVISTLRGFYKFHTGPERGWPDMAYNFAIDRFGDIWETRQGSIAGPVRGDATGGSQGFAILCSLIGNHDAEPVSQPAQASLVALLAWLSETYEIDTAPGSTIDFVSRGSNRWTAGQTVTARTISGHREMSKTACPGEFAFGLLDQDIPQSVTNVRASVASGDDEVTTNGEDAQEPTTSSTTTATAAPQTTVVEQSPENEPEVSTSNQAAGVPEDSALPAPASKTDESRAGRSIPVIGGAAALLAGALGAIIRFRGRTLTEDQ